MLAAPGDAARAGSCLVHRFRVGSEPEQEFAHGERSTLVPGSHVERRLAVLRARVMRSVRERGACAEKLWVVRYLVGLVHARSAAQEQCEDGRVAVACSRLVQWRPSHVVSNIHIVTHLAQHSRHFVDLTFLNDFKQLSGSAGLPYRHRARGLPCRRRPFVGCSGLPPSLQRFASCGAPGDEKTRTCCTP